VYGLTYRVGRHVPGAAGALRDVLRQMVANRWAALSDSWMRCCGLLQLASCMVTAAPPNH
jgi:hypothetical protein